MTSQMKGWNRVAFGDMAQNVTDRVDDPSEAGVEFYVGLEHLDSGSLKVRRWGSPTDVEATKLRFARGDIIFGKRRVYQRKLAVADFDGICSAHAMVIRPRTQVVDPSFLPFFMQSDVFMKRALEISVGSLSPTINWKTLAAQEFDLPPLGEQRRFAEILADAESVYAGYLALAERAETVRDSMSIALVAEAPQAVTRRIAELLVLSRAGLWGDEPGLGEADARVLTSTDLTLQGSVRADGGVLRSFPARALKELVLRPGDILLEKSGGGPGQPVGRVALVDEEVASDRCICGNFIQLLRSDPERTHPEWLFWLLFGLHRADLTLRHQTQTTGIRNLQVKDYLAQVVSVPPLAIQTRLADSIRSAEVARRAVAHRAERCYDVKAGLLDRLGRN